MCNSIILIDQHGTNSTMFTSCCETAICSDQRTCPSCGEDVVGHDAASDYERRNIRWNVATRHWGTCKML